MKSLISKLLVVFLVIGLGGCNQKELKPEGSEIKLMFATDLHLLAQELFDDSETSQEIYELRDGKLTPYGKEIVETLVEKTLAEKPDALILGGDLTFNGEKKSHEELAQLLEPLKDAGIQVLVIPGNHDIRNPYSYGYTNDQKTYQKTIEADDFKEIYKDYGYQVASYKDKASLSYLYKASEDVWIMLLDSQKYEYNSNFGLTTDSNFRVATVTWMQEMFEKANEEGALIIPITHQSALHNDYLGDNSEYVIGNWKDLTGLMVTNNSPVIFSGHIHAQMIISYTEDDQTIYDVATEALAVPTHQYGIINIIPHEKLTYQAYSLDVSQYAKEHDLTDPNLLDFATYGKNHFTDMTYNLFLSNFQALDLPDGVAQQLAWLASQLNPAYFAGDFDTVEQLKSTEAYALAMQYKDVEGLSYFTRVFTPRSISQRSLEVELK